MKRLPLKAFLGGLGLLVACGAAIQATADEPVTAAEQMVVAANPHATEAGIRILRSGGSAVDAAIAVQLVLSLVEPQSSGIGGGAFMLHFDGSDASGQVTVYSGRETAPAAAGPDMFLSDNGTPGSFLARQYGGLPVGVPGVMRMLELAHADHGRLPWAELFDPAIELAENGFEISPRLYFLLDRIAPDARAESFRAHYFDAAGNAHETGHLLVNDEYAATLRLLAAEGAEPMYTGALARAIVERVNENAIGQGFMTAADLEGYRAEQLEALCSAYRQWRVCGPQLPSSGGLTVQQILGLLERFDIGELRDDPVTAIHLLAEAGRLAFADRSLYMADPEFVDVPVAELLDPVYVRQRSLLIDPASAMGEVVAGEPLPAVATLFSPSPVSEMTSTSHFSIVDRYGNAVSMTSSVQGAFGSQLMVGGFILNNQLTDFAFQPEVDGRPVANRPEGGKRPLSSMTPSIVFDNENRLRLLIGSPGGTRIISYVAQAIVGFLDFGLNIQEAVAAPHFLSRGGPIELEQNTDLAEHADALRALGHDVAIRGLNSGLHGIAIDYGDRGRMLLGGVDPRREGLALGD
ncbi:MAG TPA: gamma-glutamyltransferase [Gammaproteobacteria bacterium]|jgi:gamma-glutamyltranspeptidase/glutathione hydrolase